MSCAVTSGANPSDGSSSKSSLGREIKARPMTNICRSPPESVDACRRRELLSRGKSSNIASIALCRSRRPMHHNVASRRFSSTVNSAMTPRPSGTWATPRRAIVLHGSSQELVSVKEDSAGTWLDQAR